MVDLIHGLHAEAVAANLARVHDRIAAAGRDPHTVEVLAAVKYLPTDALGALREAGVTLVGENRAQQLLERAPLHTELTWDFIGTLQSRKVAQILPHVRYVHSVATDSALTQLARHGSSDTRILVEVNVSGEHDKAGIAPADLEEFLSRCPVEVVGLMTMPPATGNPQTSRPYFAALRDLAAQFGLPELSMGTSQDYEVAVQEGATIVRLGSTLYK